MPETPIDAVLMCRQAIAAHLGVELDAIRPDTDCVAELGFDSLDFAEVITAIEDEYGIDVPADDLPTLTTVQRIAEAVAAGSSPAR